MARISGVNLPKEKRLEVALTFIYGVGRKKSTQIIKEANLDKDKKVQDLTEDEAQTLREIISRISVEGDLKRKTAMDVKRLKEIRCYRGARHAIGLPVRGQNTRTNCRTRKGKGKTVANKKQATK